MWIGVAGGAGFTEEHMGGGKFQLENYKELLQTNNLKNVFTRNKG